jgi:hypothetical protein
MENLKARLEQLKGQEAQILMQLDEVRVLINAYETRLKKRKKKSPPKNKHRMTRTESIGASFFPPLLVG